MDSLDVFRPETRAWFERNFAAPTPAQEKGWPAIAGPRATKPAKLMMMISERMLSPFVVLVC